MPNLFLTKVQKQLNGRKTVISTNRAETIEHPWLKNVNLDLKLMPYTKISSKEIMRLNVKCKSIKLLGKKKKSFEI